MPNTNKNGENLDVLDFKLRTLERIYDRQHYFIDRHEVMAEKILITLMIIGGFVSIIFSLFSKPLSNLFVWGLLITFEILFFVFFLYSIYLVIQTVRPLSSKALEQFDEKFLPRIGKQWVTASLIYHRGILKFINDSLAEGKHPVDMYYSAIDRDNITRDYVKQIFILAYYSNYKRRQLENTTKYAIITIILGILSVIVCLFSTCPGVI